MKAKILNFREPLTPEFWRRFPDPGERYTELLVRINPNLDIEVAVEEAVSNLEIGPLDLLILPRDPLQSAALVAELLTSVGEVPTLVVPPGDHPGDFVGFVELPK